MTYDLVIRGGTLVDPARSISARRDVAFLDGRVAAVEPVLAGDLAASDTIDARGALVTPGLIDLHAHVYDGMVAVALHADRSSLVHGVTTVVDAGSAGWRTFRGLREYVLPAYRTRVYAFLHIGAIGLATVGLVPELAMVDLAQPEETSRVANENADVILGIKVRIAHAATGKDDPANAREALRRARRAADATRLRLMVHIADTPIPLPEILDHLGPGDIVTHVFNGRAERVLGADGRVRPEVKRAVERGVIMDVGHASVHCDIEVARQAMADGLLPTTLSTDLHNPPSGRVVYNLRGLMSKFLALGLPLEEVVAATTSRAAAAIGKSGEIGSLAPGMAGDAVVLDMEDGDFRFVDSAGHEVKASRRFRTRHVVRGGRRLSDGRADSDLVV